MVCQCQSKKFMGQTRICTNRRTDRWTDRQSNSYISPLISFWKNPHRAVYFLLLCWKIWTRWRSILMVSWDICWTSLGKDGKYSKTLHKRENDWQTKNKWFMGLNSHLSVNNNAAKKAHNAKQWRKMDSNSHLRESHSIKKKTLSCAMNLVPTCSLLYNYTL